MSNNDEPYRRIMIDDDDAPTGWDIIDTSTDDEPVRQLDLSDDGPGERVQTLTERVYRESDKRHVKYSDGFRSVERAIRDMKLDGEYYLEPKHRPNGDRIPNENSIVSPGGRIVSKRAVSDNYGLIQPRDAFAILQPFLDAENRRIVDGGSFSDGQRLFLNASGGTATIAGQHVEQRLMVIAPYDGISAWQMLEHGKNFACMNAIPGILSAAKKNGNCRSIRHTRFAADRLNSLAEAFAASVNNWDASVAEWTRWAGTKITQAQIDAFCRQVFKTTEGEFSTKTRNRVERLLDCYESADGAAAGTAWGLSQACTFLATHEPNVQRNTDPMESTFLGSAARWNETCAEAIAEGVRTNFQYVSLS